MAGKVRIVMNNGNVGSHRLELAGWDEQPTPDEPS
jgi:hypothetical protein